MGSKVKPPRVTTIDFETAGIERRPKYPPIPVGVSILKPGQKKSRYYAWGHPQENNCSKEEARNALREVWDSGDGILCHNSKFDLDVAETHFQLPLPRWERIHDSMFLLFLDNPYSPDFKLKAAAKRLLGMEPEERDAVKDWILVNVPEMQKGYPWPKVDRWGHKIDRTKPKRYPFMHWGYYICRAPGNLVGKYADGDVVRTAALFNHLYPSIVERGMLPAYDRERKLLPILLRNEREGVRLDLDGAEKAHASLAKGMQTCDDWLRKRLKAPDLEVGSDKQLADALDGAGVVSEWVYTAPSKTHPEGQRSVSKDNLTPSMFSDKRVAQALGYRNRCQTLMVTFLEPWIEMGEVGGRIYTSWNQIKGDGTWGGAGAGTGRLSSSPNFQNIPQEWEDEESSDPDRFIHPGFLRSLGHLPLARGLLLPDKGWEWLKRDYSQQEYRATAHFEDGVLAAEYCTNPKADMHKFVQRQIFDVTGQDLSRKIVKTLNFGMLYGMGLAKLAKKLGITVEEARRVKKSWQKALPDVVTMDEEIKQIGKIGGTIVTWGGRVYSVKPPAERKDGGWQTFEYKMLNDLIQGSSADCTKEAMIRYDEVRKDSRLLIQVHDELNITAPPKASKIEMRKLRDAMGSVGIALGEEPSDDGRFRVPMLSEGFRSTTTWAAIEEWEP